MESYVYDFSKRGAGGMARIRYIKPTFFEDTDIADLSLTARLLYVGLWCFMDKGGTVEDNPKLIKRNVFPYDSDITEDRVDLLLQELADNGYLIPLVIDGKYLLHCPTFAKNQKCHPGEKTVWTLTSNLLATYKQPTRNLQAGKKCAGIGIGIGTLTGTGTGIGTGTGTGTLTGTGTPSATSEEEALYAGQSRLEALRALHKVSPQGSGAA